jgi:hypothetical protein
MVHDHLRHLVIVDVDTGNFFFSGGRVSRQKAGQGGGLIASSHDLDISTTEEQLDALTGGIKECVY